PEGESLQRMLERVERETELDPTQVAELRALVNEFRDCFADKPGRTSLVEHDIELTTDTPIRSRPYR
ncbi:hypothetical protein IscW_ISCW006652, partial [Ixodes scapularis]